ncbi:MAG: hypothetical protein EAX95_08745 [Candidatus Thorarchaeota archaeon]|nr:hypothetical protein [Candidatus Thorarchaeota archaeon]
MSEIFSRRIYTFKPRFGHQLSMGAAEIRNAVLHLGMEVLGNEFSAEILSEEENTIEVQCSAATGQLVYEMDYKLMIRILNFCEKENIDFSIEPMEARHGRTGEWV